MGILHKLFGKYLLVTNTVSCGIMMAMGDMIQQRGEHWKQHNLPERFSATEQNMTNQKPERKRKIMLADVEINDKVYRHDYIRTRNMATVGILQGPFHHYFYAFLDRVLPGRNTGSIIKKTIIDQTVASPTCLAIFFFGLGILEHRSIESINEEVKLKFFDTWKFDCCFWPPTQALNFLYVPIQYRVIYINLMTMIYDIFLSYIKYDAQFN